MRKIIFPLSLSISLRFRKGCYIGSMASIISFISTASISIGVAVLIIGLSAMNGFERELHNRILSVIPHGEIESVNQPWNNWKQSLKIIKKVPGVAFASEYVNFTGIAKSGINLIIIQIKGINQKKEEQLSALPNFIKKNSWKNFIAGHKRIIIGKGVSDTLKINTGDWISIIIPKFNFIHKIQKLKSFKLHVIGILQLNSQVDHNFAMIPLEDARQYLEIGNSITGIAIKMNDAFDVKKIAYNVGEVIKNHTHIKVWIEKYGYIYHDIQMIRSIIYISMLLLIIISYFNIISTLIIVVKNKRKDIAILRTFGVKNRFIYFIFTWYGFISGIKSSLLGVIIGVITSFNLTKIINSIEKLIRYHLISGEIYFINFIAAEVHWFDIFYIMILTILLSLLASLYPSYRANCIDPANVLKNQ